ncbi:MAG: VirB8/TrbF family protein [Alphaproteobacteria bacterium]
MQDIFNTVFKYKEKESPDTLGYYPERVHVGAFPERRYLWSSRMLVILSTTSIAINIVLASTLILLLPQRTVIPRMLHPDQDFYGLAQTQPAEKRVLATDLLAESDIADYIKTRYGVSSEKELDDAKRGDGSRFFFMSSTEAYSKYLKTEVEYTNILRGKGLTRDVEIQWIKPIAVGLWQAQFITYDKYPDKPEDANVWRALIRIAYRPIPFKTKADIIKNPYKFVVESFNLSYVGKKDDSEI